ncbi:Ras-GAP domain-containing protein [Balamuthia mandrillaris]
MSITSGSGNPSKSRLSLSLSLPQLRRKNGKKQDQADGSLPRGQELLKMLFSPKMCLVEAMCDGLKAEHYDEFCGALIPLFESQQRAVPLIKWTLSRDLQKTNDPSLFFRGISTGARLVSLYCMRHGKEYLGHLLQPILQPQHVQQLDLEVDPMRLGSREKLQKNQKMLKATCKALLSRILGSASDCPLALRDIFQYSHNITSSSPDVQQHIISNFFFLRFLCPALVSPDAYGLLPSDVTITSKMRRSLVLVSKVMHNLANDVAFGDKEPYMSAMNAFLEKKRKPVQNFITKLIDIECDGQVSSQCTVDDSEQEKAMKTLHKLLAINMDAIGLIFVREEKIKQWEKLQRVLSSSNVFGLKAVHQELKLKRESEEAQEQVRKSARGGSADESRPNDQVEKPRARFLHSQSFSASSPPTSNSSSTSTTSSSSLSSGYASSSNFLQHSFSQEINLRPRALSSSLTHRPSSSVSKRVSSSSLSPSSVIDGGAPPSLAEDDSTLEESGSCGAGSTKEERRLLTMLRDNLRHEAQMQKALQAEIRLLTVKLEAEISSRRALEEKMRKMKERYERDMEEMVEERLQARLMQKREKMSEVMSSFLTLRASPTPSRGGNGVDAASPPRTSPKSSSSYVSAAMKRLPSPEEASFSQVDGEDIDEIKRSHSDNQNETNNSHTTKGGSKERHQHARRKSLNENSSISSWRLVEGGGAELNSNPPPPPTTSTSGTKSKKEKRKGTYPT